MFTVSKTYEIVTFESVENGEAEDSGFKFKDYRMTLREVLRELRDMGGGHLQRTYNGLTLYAYDAHINYSTGEHTTYALHVVASPRNINRLSRFVKFN